MKHVGYRKEEGRKMVDQPKGGALSLQDKGHRRKIQGQEGGMND